MLTKKFLILFLFVGLTFISTSCQPDYVTNQDGSENPTPNPQNPNPNPGTARSIVGKWKKIGITDDTGVDIAYHYHDCVTIADYIQYFANGTVKDVAYLEDCVTTEEDNGTYSVAGTVLTIQGSNPDGNMVTGQLAITELTTTSLKIKVPEMGFVILYEKY